MNKCTKVKNPCKLCFRTVTTKTGVQCKGVCKKWAHYKCLNYTPGKIQDIKAGLVRITCPCPDCNSSEPKEIFVDSPYTCTNFQCPANSLPICESTECPSMYHITKQSYMAESSPSSISTNIRPRCSARKCDRPPTPPLSISISCPPESPSFPSSCNPPFPSSCNPPFPSSCNPPFTSSCNPPFPNSCTPPFKKKCDPFPYKPCPPPSRCPQSSCTYTPPLRQVCSKPKICKNKMCSPIRSLSCSIVGEQTLCKDSYNTWLPRENKNEGCDAETAVRCMSSSDSQLSKTRETQKSLYYTMEQMCTTVGQLSNQLKELMCRMMEAFEKTRSRCD